MGNDIKLGWAVNWYNKTEKSPDNRTKCSYCNETVKKGEIRVSVKNRTSNNLFIILWVSPKIIAKSVYHFHLNCLKKLFGEISAELKQYFSLKEYFWRKLKGEKGSENSWGWVK